MTMQDSVFDNQQDKNDIFVSPIPNKMNVYWYVGGVKHKRGYEVPVPVWPINSSGTINLDSSIFFLISCLESYYI